MILKNTNQIFFIYISNLEHDMYNSHTTKNQNIFTFFFCESLSIGLFWDLILSLFEYQLFKNSIYDNWTITYHWLFLTIMNEDNKSN